MNTNDNRKNTTFDNDLNRVVERAKRYGIKPEAWLCVSTETDDIHVVPESGLAPYERANNVGLRWRISPLFNREVADINGYPVQ